MPEQTAGNPLGGSGVAIQQAISTEGTYKFSYHGNGGTLFGIFIVNLFLTLITLGFYSFWGRVRIRNYLWGQTEFAGDRFAYHGNGKELLVGSMKAGVIIGIPIIFLGLIRDFTNGGIGLQIAVQLLTYAVILFAAALATVGARRYRLSRTSWRGVRFSFRGETKSFLKLLAAGAVLSILTLSLYYPIFLSKRSAFLMRHSYFGNRKFEFDGAGRELFWPFVAALVLTIPTLGFNWFWFQARKRRYLWNHSLLSSARFRCTIPGGELLALHLVNFLLIAFTLGLAWPWVRTRNILFTFAHLELAGALDFESIQQEAQSAPATGEGLASLFDLDAGFDIG